MQSDSHNGIYFEISVYLFSLFLWHPFIYHRITKILYAHIDMYYRIYIRIYADNF